MNSTENSISFTTYFELFLLNENQIDDKIRLFTKDVTANFYKCQNSDEYCVKLKNIKEYLKSKINITKIINDDIMTHYNNDTTSLLSTNHLLLLLGYIKHLNIADLPEKPKPMILKKRHRPFCKLDVRIPKILTLHFLIAKEKSLPVGIYIYIYNLNQFRLSATRSSIRSV